MGWTICPICCGEYWIEDEQKPDVDPRLIHDAVLPEVVGDYEAAEA